MSNTQFQKYSVENLEYLPINQSSEWAGLHPAQPGPARLRVAHGPIFFHKKNHGLGWAEF